MQKGFTLLEILVSISITLVLGAAVFQLFQQNERVFSDQNLVTEMQQAARAGIFQAADEIRMAGQGVPIYAQSYGEAPSEETVVILSGSSSTRINLRVSLSPAESFVTLPRPVALTVGNTSTVTVDDATGLYDAVGGGPAGRFVYFWGDSSTTGWQWSRALIRSIAPSSRNVNVTAVSSGPAGVAGGAVQYPDAPAISLEEAVALFYDNSTGSVRRTTATNMTDPVHPVWSPANELVSNVRLLHFDYFDHFGNSINPDSLTERVSVASVEIRLAVQTAQDLRNKSRPVFALSVRTNIRSSRIH